MAAVMNGEVLFAIDNAPASRQQVLAGALRALGVSTAKRAGTMPEIPTLMEQGVEDFDVSSWYGIAAPAGVAPAIVERLSRELVAAVEDPAIAARLRDYGAEPAPLGTEAYAAFMAAEAAKWAPVVRAAGLGWTDARPDARPALRPRGRLNAPDCRGSPPRAPAPGSRARSAGTIR